MALYGGRIDSNHDMLILKTYLKKYFSTEVMQGSESLMGNIQVPQGGGQSASNHLSLFKQLPDSDTPQTFGLPVTADISVQKFKAMNIVKYLRKIKTGTAASLSYNQEEWKVSLAPILKLWKTLYKQLADSGVSMNISSQDLASDNPIQSFIMGELNHGVTSIKKIGESIKKLIRLLRGEIPLDENLRKLGIDLISNKLPIEWVKIWEGPSLPSQWLNDFFKKVIALNKWLQRLNSSGSNDPKSQNAKLFSQELNLSDLFNPEVFLNAHKLIISRELKVPMEQLKV